MQPRFPSPETICDGLGDNANQANYHARSAGAFRGIYEVASKEFDILRGLATAALSGHPDNIAALRSYLAIQATIADLYHREKQYREAQPTPTKN